MALFFRGLFSILVIFSVVVVVLFVDFAYKTFSVRQRDIATDAIVVLAGGRGRVEEGVRLFRDRQGKYLFLIGVDPLVRKRELFRDRQGEDLSERVFLEKASRNTLENALYGREIIDRKDIRSIRLITSRYHMKRATLIFRNTLPRDIAIYPHPVDSINLKQAWWRDKGSFRLLFSEFYKYCLFRFFFLFASGELRPPAGP
ncbi:YdcF family protein [Geobacter benzoatilyticus]|uniref:YdcF family protein n=1 Tax=Geobacter benzoatilyticus TaxID=2815309 RepID=A0ABX7Q2A4_9BACT|nr:YdcF family protein [Geobacter benzoatilyticus]QSV45551.1 YdcF family protein [Geobacter benzoatilyticus]